MNAYFGLTDVQIRAQLLKAEQHIQQLEAALEQVKRRPYIGGVCAGVTDTRALVFGQNCMIEPELPQDPELRKQIKPGVALMLDMESNAIRGIITQAKMGMTGTISKIVSKWTAEVSAGRVVLTPPEMKVRLDDRVVLDPFANAVVVENLGKEDTEYTYAENTGITWDDVGGLEDAKRLLVEAIEEPIKHRDVYEKYGKKSAKGVLLYGPPGTGKTLLARAAATAVATAHGADARKSGFLYIKGAEILNKFVGESEAGIRRIFKAAREHKRRHGVPAVVFFDEVDALLAKRGGTRAIEGMERTIVPQFLSEMDGLDESSAIVLLATNRPDTLDSAVVREGRIDRKIHITRPTKEDAKRIVGIHLRSKPVGDKRFAEQLTDELFAPKHVLFMIRCNEGGDRRMTLGDLASGAMIAGAVERATQLAIRRALTGDDTGLQVADAVQAVKEMASEEKNVDHSFEIEAFVEPFRRIVKGWEKAA